MAEVRIQLFGGEQDGYRTSVDLRGLIPECFYIWRAADNDLITSATGRQRVVLADRLAVLAYRLADNELQKSLEELHYVRHAPADRPAPHDGTV